MKTQNRRRKRGRRINKGNLAILMVIAIAALVLIGAGGAWLLTNREPSFLKPQISSSEKLKDKSKDVLLAVYYPQSADSTFQEALAHNAETLFNDLKTQTEGYQKEQLGGLSPRFQSAIREARETLAASHDPQLSDLALDRACYEEMAQLAQETGSAFLQGYVRLAVDVANLRAAVRVARIGKGSEFLSQVLLPGGSVSQRTLVAARGEELNALFQSGALAQAAELGAKAARPAGGSLTAFERECDNALTRYLGDARRVPFGVETVIAYLYAKEAELTAIRTIFAGRAAKLEQSSYRDCGPLLDDFIRASGAQAMLVGPDGALSMEITLDHGRGYIPADKNKSAQQVIGTIPVDSIYAPVLKVNYAVENTRVGNQTDFDKLTVEVWTDKTISARDALSLGAKILCDHFTLFTDLSDTIGNSCTVVEKEPERPDTVMKMTIEELDLSVRSFNCLKRANINTVEDLTNKTEEEMIKVRNLGRKSLEEVEHKLAMMGLSLASDDNQ